METYCAQWIVVKTKKKDFYTLMIMTKPFTADSLEARGIRSVLRNYSDGRLLLVRVRFAPSETYYFVLTVEDLNYKIYFSLN